MISLNGPSDRVVSLSYDTTIGTASYSDFKDISAYPFSFAPGETSKLIGISLVDDTTPEDNETFYLNLFSPINGVIGTSPVTGTIIDNDG